MSMKDNVLSVIPYKKIMPEIALRSYSFSKVFDVNNSFDIGFKEKQKQKQKQYCVVKQNIIKSVREERGR